MPCVKTIGEWAFDRCHQLIELDLPADLDTVGQGAFDDCPSLRRITMPLKDNMISANVFDGCTNLTTLNLVGGIHKVIASLHMESWRNEMREEINRSIKISPTLMNGERQQECSNGSDPPSVSSSITNRNIKHC
jgi:hypothetical protein